MSGEKKRDVFALNVPDSAAGVVDENGFKIPYASRLCAYEQLKKYVTKGTFVASTKKPTKQTYISIEGSIGVGKTHLSKCIENLLATQRPSEKVYLIEEQVNMVWLTAFIEDPIHKAALFQIKRLMETINAVKEMWAKSSVHREYKTMCHCIGDRLPLGNFPFALVHHSLGNIDAITFDLYGHTLSDGGPYNYPDTVLLLCKAETALERIKKRDRRGESSYTKEYLEQLDEATLFTFLYIWYTGVTTVVPFCWDEFNTPEYILAKVSTISWKDKTVQFPVLLDYRKEIRRSLLTMPYHRMREMAYHLAEIAAH